MVEKSPKTLIINKKNRSLDPGVWMLHCRWEKAEINILCFLVETFQWFSWPRPGHLSPPGGPSWPPGPGGQGRCCTDWGTAGRGCQSGRLAWSPPGRGCRMARWAEERLGRPRWRCPGRAGRARTLADWRDLRRMFCWLEGPGWAGPCLAGCLTGCEENCWPPPGWPGLQSPLPSTAWWCLAPRRSEWHSGGQQGCRTARRCCPDRMVVAGGSSSCIPWLQRSDGGNC